MPRNEMLFEMLDQVVKRPGGGGGIAAEQGIIFRIPTPGQGIIFVKIGSTTGSIWGPYGHF